jgi:multicomponent Na+:H+ antiporter subunit D
MLSQQLLEFSLRPYALMFVLGFIISACFGSMFLIGAKYDKKELLLSIIQGICAILAILADNLVMAFIFYEIIEIALIITIFNHKPNYQFALLHIFSSALIAAGIASHVAETNCILIDDFCYEYTFSHLFILAGLLINIGSLPFSMMVVDGYYKASKLSINTITIYSSKVALFFILSMFFATKWLMFLGLGMIIYGGFSAFIENSLRRFACYNIIAQQGFILVAIGIGSDYALKCAAIMVFCHIIAQQLLTISISNINMLTAKEFFTEITLNYKNYKVSFLALIVGSLSACAFPLTGSFVAKAMLASEIATNKIIAQALDIASIATIMNLGLKLPLFMFALKTSKKRVIASTAYQTPTIIKCSMLGLMLISIFFGIFPKYFDNLLFDKLHFKYNVDMFAHYMKLWGLAILIFIFTVRPLLWWLKFSRKAVK